MKIKLGSRNGKTQDAVRDAMLTVSIHSKPAAPGKRHSGTVHLNSGEALQPHRMMRHVFVEIGEDQQEFEHAVALKRTRRLRSVFQVIDDHQRVGEQPFERPRVDRVPGAAILKGPIGAHKSFVEEVVEAKLFSQQRARNRIRARIPATRYCPHDVQNAPRSDRTH